MKAARAKTIARVLLLAAAAAACAAAGPARAEKPLALHGASIFEATVIRPLKNGIERDTGLRLEVVPNRSDLGLLALARGEIDLAMISGSLDDQLAELKARAPALPWQKLQAHAITPTRVAFVINAANPVRRLTLAQVAQILAGEITSWKQVGGDELPVRVVAVKQGGGTLNAVERELLGRFAISAPDAIRVRVGAQVIKVVTQEVGAIGISQRSHMRGEVGVRELATDETIEPMLSLVSLGPPEGAAARLIEALRARVKAAP